MMALSCFRFIYVFVGDAVLESGWGVPEVRFVGQSGPSQCSTDDTGNLSLLPAPTQSFSGIGVPSKIQPVEKA